MVKSLSQNNYPLWSFSVSSRHQRESRNIQMRKSNYENTKHGFNPNLLVYLFTLGDNSNLYWKGKSVKFIFKNKTYNLIW